MVEAVYREVVIAGREEVEEDEGEHPLIFRFRWPVEGFVGLVVGDIVVRQHITRHHDPEDEQRGEDEKRHECCGDHMLILRFLEAVGAAEP